LNIIINNESLQLHETISIHQLLSHLNIKQLNGIAVAIDEQVIKKSDWENVKLLENQKVTIITASQGG